MSALTALLARDRVVPPQRIDEAIQRQVTNGGDFETNLLEIGAVDEDTLCEYCAAVYGLEPVAHDELLAADPAVLALLPRAVAEAQRVVPLALREGALRVAVAAPLGAQERAALTLLLGYPVEPRITTPFRVQWGLWRFYGVELSPRLQRLAQRLDARAPEPRTTPRRRPVPSVPPPAAPQSAPRLASALAALTAALTDERESEAPHEPPAPAPVAPAPAVPAVALPPPTAPTAPATRTAPRGVPRVTLTGITLDVARGRVAAATSRDEAVAALLEYARARVAYAAAFGVRGELAEGLDARGAGADPDTVRKLAVPLDAPGAFRTARDRGEVFVGVMDATRTDRVISDDLARPKGAMIALLPVAIAGRVVLILWADDAGPALAGPALDELRSLCAETARAFERLIVERKRRAAAPVAPRMPSMPPPAASGAPVAAPPPAEPPPRVEPTPTPSDLDAEDAGKRDTLESVPPSPAVHDGERVGTYSTRFARGGGRVPVAVDVVGPLPGEPVGEPAPAEYPSRSERAPAFDPRRESEHTPPAHGDADVLVAQAVRTGALSDEDAARLLGAGEGALAAAFRYFPGPTNFDRLAPHPRLPSVAEIGPLLRLVVMFRQAAAPWLIDHLESASAEQRYFATLGLGEVVNAAALPGLLQRLFDPDIPTRAVAVEVLRNYRRFYDLDEVFHLLRAITSDPSAAPERRRIAAHALGELRDAEAVPSLLYALVERDPALVSVARRSLVVLARQDFGEEVPRWRAWWELAAPRHRVEWLIDALLHDDATIRHEASEELKKLTGQFFGYYFNLPRREREKAHRRYVDWWEREGRTQFGAA